MVRSKATKELRFHGCVFFSTARVREVAAAAVREFNKDVTIVPHYGNIMDAKFLSRLAAASSLLPFFSEGSQGSIVK